jgi:hypothetical protein
MFEVPELRIQQVEGRYAAVCGTAEIPLPTPEHLKREAIAVCQAAGDDAAAEALRDCDLSYAIALGQGIEQLIEVVVAAPAGVFEALEEPGNPLAREVMGALLEACPDLGSDRVVLRT